MSNQANNLRQTAESTGSLLDGPVVSPTDHPGPEKRRFLLLLSILLLTLTTLGLTTLLLDHQPSAAAALPADDSKIDDLLHEMLQEAESDELLRVIIYMQDPPQDVLADLPIQPEARRVAVAENLQQAAARSQAAIQRDLKRLSAANVVASYQTLWIINGLGITAKPEAITSLAGRPDVARIGLDARIRVLSPMTVTEAVQPQDLPWSLHQTRVQHAWDGLGITGTGVTIAIMDTGADWLHPALLGSYRGVSIDGSPRHELAWFDTIDGSPTPFDPNGHGTHVIGTASGRNDIGVAPGSSWMAVRILDQYGFGYFSEIHAGFQWLLAPDGDPSLGPDIVNGSWSAHPELDEFAADINALHAAGIITVFSAGNSGPGEGTLRSPANYPGVVAVGASDDIDQVAWFSARGPSYWTTEIKPTILAPGTQILSALPGGQYGVLDGTSMAAPHVAGMHALVLSANPGLNAGQVTAVLTKTALLADGAAPDGAYGWGRADAYAAVSSIVSAGRLAGHVTGAGLHLPGAAVTITTPGGVHLNFQTASDGSFAAELLPGLYDISVSAYGYEPYLDAAVEVLDTGETYLTIDLERLPYGTVSGRIADADTNLPLTGAIRIAGTALAFPVGIDGRFEIELPVGQYELLAWVSAYRLGKFDTSIAAGETVHHDFLLPPGPNILLVDTGQWYSGSQVEYFAIALQHNDYSYSTLTVRDPLNDTPTTEMLTQFDIVVWSSPLDSPGRIGAGTPLSEYLDSGGKALISGQNVGLVDKGQPFPQRWWHYQLRAQYLGKEEAPFNLTGEPGSVFEDLQFSLSPDDSAGNEVSPDASMPIVGTLTSVGLRYSSGDAAALLAGQCEPFRLAYFGFGLETVLGSDEQASLLASAFDFFEQPETEVGVLFDRPELDDLVPPAGRRIYPIRLLNLSETLTDTISLELADSDWPARIVTDTLTLGPCQSADTILEVNIPGDLPLNMTETFSLVASSTNFPEYRQALDIRLKLPGHILLVDDDRWYDQAPTFKEALTTAGFDFDFWENGTNSLGRGSPQLDLLNAYDFVLWYTGLDWFRPITAQESQDLLAYAQQGGRLFLTSQDYLYYHASDPLTRDYLGVLQYVESVTPTIAYGGSSPSPLADLAGPLPLEYGPYKNYSDGLVPAPGSAVSLWHNQGLAAGVASAGSDWRTVFWALPFETLPKDARAKAMDRVVGWLSDLGDSSFQVGSRTSLPGDTLNFTLTLRYASGSGSTVTMINQVPQALTVDMTSLRGGAAFNPERRQLTWQGYLQNGQQHEISYQATTLDRLPPGTRLENLVEIRYDRHDLAFERTVPFWLVAPDTTASLLTVSPAVAAPGQPLTYHLALRNHGTAAGTITAEVRLSEHLSPTSAILQASSGVLELGGESVHWHGWLQPGAEASVTIVVTAPLTALPTWLPATAVIDDGLTDPIVRDATLEIRPLSVYLPAVARSRP